MGICICTAMLSCDADSIESNEVATCSRVYVLVEDAMKREYHRYVPVAQDWAYYASEYGFRDGDSEHVYSFNHNIFINRKKEDVQHKIVTQAEYIESCAASRGRQDTIYLMVDNGETYSEILVKERFDLVSEGESVALHSIFGDSELLVDFSMDEGQQTSMDTSVYRIALRKKSDFKCHLIHQVTRFHKQDSINELFIKGIGSMHRRTQELDIRLYLIDGMEIAEYLNKACE